MLKRILAALLLAALTVTSVACSSGDGSTSDTTAGGDTSAPETTTAAETSEYTAPDVNYDGQTITVAAVDYVTPGNAGTWIAAHYIEAIANEENGDPLNDAIYTRNRKVEEELGVKIELYPFSDLGTVGTEFSKPIMSSEDLFDYAMISGAGLPTVLGTEYALELGDFGLDLSYSWWDQNSVEEFTLYDKIYTVTGDISLYNNYSPITIFFNKVLTNDYNLDDPYQAVNDGKWTFDMLMEMSKAVAIDLNGNGETDIEDSFGMISEPPTLTYMIQATGERLTKRDSDGNIIPTLNTERTISLVETFVPFMRDRAVNMFSSDFPSGYNNVFTDLFLPTFTDNRALFYNNQLLVALNLRDMEADFGILPTPKLEESQSEYYTPYNTWWATFVGVPVTNTKQEETINTIQAMGYYSQQYLTPAYIDSTVTGKTLRDEESIAMLDIILNTRIYDVGQIYNWGGIGSIGTQLAQSSSTNFASHYDSIAEVIQTAIDETAELLR